MTTCSNTRKQSAAVRVAVAVLTIFVVADSSLLCGHIVDQCDLLHALLDQEFGVHLPHDAQLDFGPIPQVPLLLNLQAQAPDHLVDAQDVIYRTGWSVSRRSDGTRAFAA